jgi:FAD/FMN-containing dehydrogenase
MNKIAQYLNEHVLGEVTSAESVRRRFSRDGSILNIMPELVVHPRVTNDIRKVARFTWQLAEKSHVMPMTVRGGGTDKTGAAIGEGIIINTLAHLNKIIYINPKHQEQAVHVQPGVIFGHLNDTLKSHGMIIPAFPSSAYYSTIGGAISNNTSGPQSVSFGSIGNWVTRLEVVLANGDIIETSRISKRELSKKKGLQTLEGELYRKVDGIIEDNLKIITDDIFASTTDNIGYPGIAKVKKRDGSFDLTPLFIGSQGTLGIISEIVLRSDYYNGDESVVVASFTDAGAARDAADALMSLKPASLDYIDSNLLDVAKSYGKKYSFLGKNVEKTIDSILIISFNETGRGANRKLKQTKKVLSKFETNVFTSENYSLDEINALREIGSITIQPEEKEESAPSLIDGASVSATRREEFVAAINELANKHHIDLPLQINWLNGIVHARPILNLHHIGDKQKTLKLIADYTDLIAKLGGSICAESSEGRLKTNAAYAHLDDNILDIYAQIRTAFDPLGTMNPGVKQKNDFKKLVQALNSDFSLTDFAQYSPRD